MPIQCAHVRDGTDGGMGLKPNDLWTVPMCAWHHLHDQHVAGEVAFEIEHGISLHAIALEFALKSPVPEVQKKARLLVSQEPK